MAQVWEAGLGAAVLPDPGSVLSSEDDQDDEGLPDAFAATPRAAGAAEAPEVIVLD
jgi:hypothetical protein